MKKQFKEFKFKYRNEFIISIWARDIEEARHQISKGDVEKIEIIKIDTTLLERIKE